MKEGRKSEASEKLGNQNRVRARWYLLVSFLSYQLLDMMRTAATPCRYRVQEH